MLSIVMPDEPPASSSQRRQEWCSFRFAEKSPGAPLKLFRSRFWPLVERLELTVSPILQATRRRVSKPVLKPPRSFIWSLAPARRRGS